MSSNIVLDVRRVEKITIRQRKKEKKIFILF